jgi:RimJ/RimL family protein N-acetyltransferase
MLGHMPADTTTADLLVPTLMAGPFRLRPFALGDVHVVREASEDPHIPLITTVPAASAYSADEGRRFIERQWDRAATGIGYSFAIADGVSNQAVGQVGLWRRDISRGRADLGYWVAGSARGRRAAGYAVRAVAAWAHEELRIARLELYVEPWNTASIRTAESAGFQREGLLRSWQEVGGIRKDMYMYSRLATDPVPRP